MSIRILLILVSLGGAVSGQAPSISSLAEKMDPAKDDWEAEAFQASVEGALGRLKHVFDGSETVEEVLEGVARAEATLRPLGKSETPVETASGFVVTRAGQGDDGVKPVPLDDLATLVAPLSAATGRRAKIKVIGVARAGEGWRTRLRYEAFGRDASGVLQMTGEMTVAWSVAGEGGPRIASITMERLEQVRRSQPLFVDSTAAVLAPLGKVDDLELGSEWWHGRIDAVGESVLMGHHGVAVGDVNGDGLEDLYVAMGTGFPNRLLVQQADGTVRDEADAWGVAWLDDTKGVVFADYDNDGDQDLLCALGHTIVICRNEEKKRFGRMIGIKAATPAAFYAIALADYDLDGDLDVYACRYVKVKYGTSIPQPLHDAENGPSNILLRNDGEDRFSDVTAEVGLDANNTRFSLAAAWGDYDADGDPDLYVANDFGRNKLYRNDGGKFVDVAAEAGVEDQAAGMGASWADVDLDGDLDLYVTNMFSAAGNRIAYQDRFQKGADTAHLEGIRKHSLGNSLFLNQGNGTFRPGGDAAGVRMGRWGWGARFVDFDDDGAADIVAPNGFLTGRLPDDC